MNWVKKESQKEKYLKYEPMKLIETLKDRKLRASYI